MLTLRVVGSGVAFVVDVIRSGGRVEELLARGRTKCKMFVFYKSKNQITAEKKRKIERRA